MAVGPEHGGLDDFPMHRHVRGSSCPCSRPDLPRHIDGLRFVSVLLSPVHCRTHPGHISDQSGAAVAGATVVVTDVQRGTSRTLTTDQAGAYAPPTCARHLQNPRRGQRASRPSSEPTCASKSRLTFARTSRCKPGRVSEIVNVHGRSSLGQYHFRDAGRNAKQQRDQRPAAEWPQL